MFWWFFDLVVKLMNLTDHLAAIDLLQHTVRQFAFRLASSSDQAGPRISVFSNRRFPRVRRQVSVFRLPFGLTSL